MNNKGQSLVAFILLLPLIFIIIAIIIDLGYLSLNKQKVQNEIKDTITYGLKHKEQATNPKLEYILNQNIDGKKQINITDNAIKINVKTKMQSVFNNIINKSYDINITYTGYIENGKIIIEKG